jgi:hypothetical protein
MAVPAFYLDIGYWIFSPLPKIRNFHTMENPDPNLGRINRINKIKSNSHFNYESHEYNESNQNPVHPVNPVILSKRLFRPSLSPIL